MPCPPPGGVRSGHLGAPGLADVYPFRLSPANTSISIFSPFEGGPPFVLDRYNDIAHLTGIDGFPRR